MPTQDFAASVQGAAIRVTRLDATGSLLTGSTDSYTTTKFIRTSFTPEYEEGDEITEKAADGTVCVSFKAPDTLKRVTMEIAICEPDPELTTLLSGGLLLTAGGKSVGWASGQVGEDPSGDGVAVEVWSYAVQNGKKASSRPYFHWIFPYVKTRQSGDRVIENGLLANTFEGFGLGNINFRASVDGTWQWPAVTDRPYAYARTNYAPIGLAGFYTWTPGATAGSAPTPRPAGDVVPDTYPIGFNVPGGGIIYPFNGNSASIDRVLSQDSYAVGTTGAATYPASAAAQTVSNPAPSTSTQPSVTYLSRGDAPLPPTSVAAGSPGTFSPSGSAQPANITDLRGLNIGSGPRWTANQYVVIGTGDVYWNGSDWVMGRTPDKAAAENGDVFASEPTVTAQDATNAAKLAGLGYVALPQTAWTTGQKITIGTYLFNWSGTAWAAGAHA